MVPGWSHRALLSRSETVQKLEIWVVSKVEKLLQTLSVFFRIEAYSDSVFCMKQIRINRFTQTDYRQLLMQVRGELFCRFPFTFT